MQKTNYHSSSYTLLPQTLTKIASHLLLSHRDIAYIIRSIVKPTFASFLLYVFLPPSQLLVYARTSFTQIATLKS
jgi:hypothetical protein